MIFSSVAAGAFAFATSWVATFFVIVYASKLGLLSVPNHRSSHVKVTPHGGGLGIYIAFMLLVIAYTLFSGVNELVLYVSGLASLIAVTGLWDDILQVPRKIRFFIQLLCCSLLVILTVNPVFSEQSTHYFSWLILPGMILLAVWWVNLFNFMDGIDGLAGSEAIFMLSGGLTLMVAFAPQSNIASIWLLMVGLMSACAGFLLHNWSPARIFMGDVGSTFLAFMILFFALMTSAEKWLSYEAWLVLGACFVCDASVTLWRRFSSGQRWFEAHNSHAYQRLSRRYISHSKVSLGFMVVNLLWLFPLAWATLTYPEFSWYLLCLAYFPLVVFIWMVGAGMPDKKIVA